MNSDQIFITKINNVLLQSLNLNNQTKCFFQGNLLVLIFKIISYSGLLLSSFTVKADNSNSVLKQVNIQQYNWQSQQSHSTASLRGISAINKKIVWVSGNQGTYLKTLDGGNTWQTFIMPNAKNADFRDVEAFTDKRAYLLAVGEGEASKIIKTTDGGKSWQIQFTNKHPKGFLNGLAFWDEQNGVAYGDMVNDRFYILRTEDGGKHWHEVTALPIGLNGEHAYAASGSGIVTAGKNFAWFATGGPAARVFYSTDKGKSWKVTKTPLLKDTETSGIYSLFFETASFGIAIGGDYKRPAMNYDNVAITYDGGKSWQLSPDRKPKGIRTIVKRIPDTSILLAVGRSGADYSLDNGKSWNHFTNIGFYSMASQGLDATWAVGSHGRIAKLVPFTP